MASHIRHIARNNDVSHHIIYIAWISKKIRGGGSPFSRYLGFYWSDFDKQGLILKLRNSSNQYSRKLSARECRSTVKSRIFSLAKLKCYTVHFVNPAIPAFTLFFFGLQWAPWLKFYYHDCLSGTEMPNYWIDPHLILAAPHFSLPFFSKRAKKRYYWRLKSFKTWWPCHASCNRCIVIWYWWQN